MVNIGKRLRKIRLAKGMSQNDVRRACGLFACYISRVENGFTVPSLQTLDVLAKGFQIPLHDFLYQLTAPRFNETVEIDNEPVAVVEPIELESQQALQTACQIPQQKQEMLETDNNVNNGLTRSENGEQPAA